MSSEEFTDWQIYYSMNPFGPYRGDVNAAFICSVLANVNAAKGKKFQPKDFLPEFKSPHVKRERMSNEEIKDFMHNFAAHQKGLA